MDKFASLKDHLSRLKADSLYRSLKTVGSRQDSVVKIGDLGEEMVLFCNNDYLNLAGHPEIKKAATDAIAEFGFGSSASRLISGTMEPHTRVEKAFSEFFEKESALYFGSGWVANEALLRTIPQKGDLILIDKLNHASIIDAAMASEAQFRTYRRGEMDKLEKHLADNRYNTKFIVTESVFSMDGDRADLAALVELKNRYDAMLIVDEAHSAGCLGEKGAGLGEELGLLNEIDIIVAPLGKAFGGQGAIIAGEKVVIDYLVNRGRAFIYTTAPVPAICAGIEKALEMPSLSEGRFLPKIQTTCEKGLKTPALILAVQPHTSSRCSSEIRKKLSMLQHNFTIVAFLSRRYGPLPLQRVRRG